MSRPTPSHVPPDARLDAPAAVWDGNLLLDAMTIATDWLDDNRDRVNALNVFPVPDGDTGTNMALTMRGALAEAATLSVADRASAAEVAARIAYGSLMGARGNSGVILSQVFRGFANGIGDRQEINGRDLAEALGRARDLAYTAVMEPVEGTMLTVVRVAAERAASSARRGPAMASVLAAALAGAEDALRTTPDLLEILRQANVVDAGGQGIVLILEGMDRFARGEALPNVPIAVGDAEVSGHMVFLDQVDDLHGGDHFGYCTNFMVFGAGIDVGRCRAEIAAMGSSAVIVGDETMLKVHVHVDNPGAVLDYAIKLGDLGQIKIDNMQAQTRALSAARPTATNDPTPPLGTATSATEPRHHVVMAVAAGEGLAEALRSMGATTVITGGQTMNPSTEEILAAVRSTDSEGVILLPNNSNIVLTAGQIPKLTDKHVRVVASRSIPQGVVALAAYHQDKPLDEAASAMTEALSQVITVELTRAVRDATIDGVTVARGQVIGLVDGRLVAAGEDLVTVALDVLTTTGLDERELVTMFTGAGALAEDIERLASGIRERHDHLEIETHAGGQPHYDLVIAVE
ncbi:MAG: Dihydroxyacetone kinase-like protein, phosphatase domain / Dihydroxyacetone kinase-like protein, kinase domain [uncultured Thermomicrobiales bacterium]|uniref:Dihydroxyacetone kinase-like protein, phosphatase domain / Dihydroxyacetone kinase-like protein, kinase domain n=1 Tax=uncultured Thermomicrobiales bacterium TaxID=1645740 RepID=A0A6J4V873_9BACT|nr:MAG: Dihydroxyacetone kinase-like protein, phosphatase domain / Dihydroxyacetone kinase-like protein, kinase domain [uncultured Thermomicrobiales bacterium]